MLFITNKNNEEIEVEDWKTIVEPITKMSFQVNDKQSIVFTGFDEYIKLKEEYKAINSPIQGTSKILLVGKAKDKVAIVTIDLIKNKITKSVKLASEAYNKKPLVSEHWKKGVSSKPKVYIQN